jgi:isocitrate dehydrogenase (NAD+)
VAKSYPNIKVDSVIIDACTMKFISKPSDFDVILTTNLYGLILANIAAGLTGGPGFLTAQSYSSDCVVYEPVSHF